MKSIIIIFKMMIEIQEDLFDIISDGDAIVHCVSADFKMGAGIALSIKNKFGEVPDNKRCNVGEVSHVNSDNYNIFHLVSKDLYYKKPSYESLRKCLKNLKQLCDQMNITKINMPKIGCGLDRLKWNMVKPMILEELTGIEVIVCYL